MLVLYFSILVLSFLLGSNLSIANGLGSCVLGSLTMYIIRDHEELMLPFADGKPTQ